MRFKELCTTRVISSYTLLCSLERSTLTEAVQGLIGPMSYAMQHPFMLLQYKMPPL